MLKFWPTFPGDAVFSHFTVLRNVFETCTILSHILVFSTYIILEFWKLHHKPEIMYQPEKNIMVLSRHGTVFCSLVRESPFHMNANCRSPPWLGIWGHTRRADRPWHGYLEWGDVKNSFIRGSRRQTSQRQISRTRWKDAVIQPDTEEPCSTLDTVTSRGPLELKDLVTHL